MLYCQWATILGGVRPENIKEMLDGSVIKEHERQRQCQWRLSTCLDASKCYLPVLLGDEFWRVVLEELCLSDQFSHQ